MTFDLNVVGAEMLRMKMTGELEALAGIDKVCTMKSSRDFCKLPSSLGYKWPSLNELYYVLFDKKITTAHDAGADVRVLAACSLELHSKGVANMG